MRGLILACALALLAGFDSAAQTVGQPAPDFTYPALDGGEIRLGDYSGKVVFVFLFGNTCPFCLAVGNRTETEIQAAFGSHPSFQAIGLDMWDSSSSTASVGSFRNSTGITYPLGLRAGSMGSLYSTTYDRLLVIGPDGVLRFKSATNVSGSLGQARDVVESLLASVASVDDVPSPEFLLKQNYPNPVLGSTEIGFQLQQPGMVKLTVHDLLGRVVAELANGFRAAGSQSVTWLPEDGLSAGLYFYTLQAGGERLSRTMLLSR